MPRFRIFLIIIHDMATQNPSRRGKKEPPLGETGQERFTCAF